MVTTLTGSMGGMGKKLAAPTPAPAKAPLFTEKPVVQDASLLTVSVLKKKFLEQMPRVLEGDLPNVNFEIVGIANGYQLVCRDTDSSHYFWTHYSDYVHLLQISHTGSDDPFKIWQKIVKTIPQLFTE